MQFKKRVLVTGAGGPAAISFIRSAPDYDYFACDIDPYAAGLYLVPPIHRFIVPKATAPEFVDELLSICSTHRIEILVPTVDDELLPISRRRNEFEQVGTRLLLSGEDCLATCLDKWHLSSRLANFDYVARTVLFDDTFDADQWQFPIILKPRQGSGSRGVRLITCHPELPKGERDGSLIVQEYLPGSEFSVDVFVDPDGKVRAAVPRERLKVDSGIAVTARTFRYPLLQSVAELIAEALSCGPVANIQFRLDQRGRPRLIEVNPRFPGTMALTVLSGVNMPDLAVRSALGQYLDPREFLFDETAIVRTWEERKVDPVQLAIMEVKQPARSHFVNAA